ncbi:MAG: TRAP transporter small permease subunit [Candidatus Aminicenantes bacterium]|nr:TRAP transporter small permease subunit [Candidatus Aminicenantes bacterium]
MPDLIGKMNRYTGIFVSFLMGLMVLDVSWQVFTRFVLKKPSPFSEELAGFLLIWVSILGAAYAFHNKAHLGIDILTSQLQGLKRATAEAAIHLIILFFALFVMLMGGARLVMLTFRLNQVSPAMGIPMGFVYSVIPLSGILIVIYSAGFIYTAIKNRNMPVPKQRQTSQEGPQ